MTLAESTSSNSDDSPEARRYNRTQRWLGIADFVIGSVFLVLLLITGWSGWLRDLALRRDHGLVWLAARSRFAARLSELHARGLPVFVLPAFNQQSVAVADVEAFSVADGGAVTREI